MLPVTYIYFLLWPGDCNDHVYRGMVAAARRHLGDPAKLVWSVTRADYPHQGWARVRASLA